MTLKLEDNIENGDLTQEKNPILQAQEPFKEKAFCIVGDELKAKLYALNLTEKDLVNVFCYENEIGEYLEFIDKYFNEVKEIKELLVEKYTKELSNYDGEDKDLVVLDSIKNHFCDLLTYHKELSILFSHFPEEGGRVIISCMEKNHTFDLIMALRKGIEKYNFSWDLLIEFFEKVPRKVYTSISDQGNSDNSFELLLEALDNLSEHINETSLFDDLLKLSIVSGKKEVGSILKTLRNFHNEDEIKMLQKHYKNLVKLGVIAGKNSPIIFTYPSVKFCFLNGKNKDLIIAGLEKLGPDFIYVFNSNSGFIENTIERFPDRFVEFCENLKKLADYSKNNTTFYGKSLTGITEFIVNYPDKWDYLLKIGEIFEKNTPGILSIGKSFMCELLKYFPDNYEEILLEVRDVGEHLYGGNEGYFLTYGLSFLARYLEKGKEEFFKNLYKLKKLNDDKLKQNNSTGSIFFEDGLDFISRCIMHLPEVKDEKWIEIGEKVIKIVNKHYSNKEVDVANFFKAYMLGMDQYIGYQIIDEDFQLLDELLNFLEKVGGSKDALRVINGLKELINYKQKVTSPNKYFTHRNNLLGWQEEHNKIVEELKKGNQNTISYTLAYLLKHKKSKIIPFIKNLNLIKDLNLGVNISSVLLGGVSLEYKSNEELQELFNGKTTEDTKIWKHFIKIGGENHPKSEEIKAWINSIIPKKGKPFDKTKILPTLIKIQNVFAELILAYFEQTIHRKIHIKFRNEFKLGKDFDDNLINEDLLELYKMYSSTRINKIHTFELIQKYLGGEVYVGSGNILETYPYNRQENLEFLKNNFIQLIDINESKNIDILKNPFYGSTANIWLSRNEREFKIESQNGEESENAKEKINHHLRVSNEKLKLLGIEEEFDKYGKILDFFDTKIKKDKEKYDKSIFDDLEFQVNEIKKLIKSSKSKKTSKIKIYHELEPLKIVMMGNWVDGSCLSFYNTVGNYWSAITNALEVNKGVFYIDDENGNIIARVLVGIDNNGELEVHPMYFKGNIEANLKKYFDIYMKQLFKKLLTTANGKRDKVKLLFCENWYSGD